LYVIFLYFVKVSSGPTPESVVGGAAAGMYGFLRMSVFLPGKEVVKLSKTPSAFLAIFAIFQLPLLRTMWHLHKDIFALANMMFAFSMLAGLLQSLVFAAVAVTADKMIGSLLYLSLTAYSAVKRLRN
jgi:hypothetical protein